MVLTVSVESLPGATEAGLNEAVAPDGSPVAVSAMLPGEPAIAAVCTVYVALLPAVTPCVEGVALIEKSSVGGVEQDSVELVLLIRSAPPVVFALLLTQ